MVEQGYRERGGNLGEDWNLRRRVSRLQPAEAGSTMLKNARAIQTRAVVAPASAPARSCSESARASPDAAAAASALRP